MSEKREFTLRLLQKGSGRTASVSISQEALGVPTILELKGDTRETYLYGLTPGARVDWGDGETDLTDESFAPTPKIIRHSYSGTVATPRIVTIYGSRSLTGGTKLGRSPFDRENLIGVRRLAEQYSDLSYLFARCHALRSIPATLFEQNKGATKLEGCFLECRSLTTLPASLFEGMSRLTSLHFCFQDCTELKSLPEGLFNDCRAETFSNCFQACTSLRSLPRDLFARQTVAKDFSGCFIGCTGLTAIPDGLFDTASMATDFSGCFSDCNSLTAIPRGLFDNQHYATDFKRCFRGCDALQGETPYALVDSRRIKLWERDPAANGYAKVKESTNCFAYATQLTDYGTIPGGWK